MSAHADRRSRGWRLSHKLLVAVLLLLLVLLAVLWFVVGPSLLASSKHRSDALVQHSITAMRELTTRHAAQHRELLVDLLLHTTEARRRAVRDLPFAIYRDQEQLRAAIERDDAERAERMKGNLAVLSIETERRAGDQIRAVLEDLKWEQDRLAETFATELRTTHAELCALLLAATVLVLGIGLHRLVVRPVANLRAATRRVADGDLAVGVEVESRDEIGALATDFETMLLQLRASRDALADLNQNLQAQVTQKTQELAQAAKMASLGTLAGGLAHEFHNLIGGIRGCAREARADEPNLDKRETLDVILRATDRATAIVSQLQRFAKQGDHTRAPVDLQRVVEDALQLLQPEARRRLVDVHRSLAQNLWVLGDDNALHQVVVNLVTNALQAMPDGGELHATARIDGDSVLLVVRDTGCGIEEQDLPRIFEPFFSRRADALDPLQRGTGLGLSVTYGIVEAHGGSIAVESTVGRGTTFTIRLPRSAR
ncbi:MAG: ATP-binding protein [Planctomycetota bacterium]